jgi:hypothetical protein
MPRLLPSPAAGHRWLSVFSLTLLCGCGLIDPEPLKSVREVTKAANSFCDSMQAVHDAQSAHAASADIDQKASKLLDLYTGLTQVIQAHKNTPVSKETAEQVMRDFAQAMQRVKSEIDRISRLRGLPADFWSAVTVKLVGIVLVSAEFVQSQGSLCDEGKETLGYLYHVRDLLTQYGYEKLVQIEFTNLPDHLAPVVYDKLTAAAGGGAVIYHVAAGNMDSTLVAHVVLGPVPDLRAFVARLDVGQVVCDEPRRRLEIQVDRRKLGARANSDAEEQQLAEAEARQRQEKIQREIEEQAERNRERIARERELDPNDPQYHEKLAERLASDDHFPRQKAIEALLRIEPDDVKSAETRKKIARAFRLLAEDPHGGHDRGKAIEGLARWGGKFSVPILLRILDEEHSWVEDAVYKALGDLKDQRAAAPVAARLGHWLQHDRAVKCLKQIGPPAEDAVLAVGPSADAKICLSAIQILGEIGSKKSLSFLRSAVAGSRNPQVKLAAKAAIKSIISRENAATDKDQHKDS